MPDVHQPSKPRDLHAVSTKAIFYTPDSRYVLVMHMFRGTDHEKFGLPGGHIDAGEVPDAAMVREIREELGISMLNLQHIDFVTHQNGKIVLAYTGTLPHDTVFAPSHPEKEVGIWMNRGEFEQIAIEPSYKQLALAHWPHA